MTKKHFLVLLVVGVVAVALLGLAPKAKAGSIDVFNSYPLSIIVGQPTTLTWETTGLTDCVITREERRATISGGGCGNVDPDGTCQHHPPATSTYTLNCRQEGSLTERHSAGVIVTVSLPPSPTPPASRTPPTTLPPVVNQPRNGERTTVPQEPTRQPRQPRQPIPRQYPLPPVITSILPAVITPLPNCIMGYSPDVITNIKVTAHACFPLDSTRTEETITKKNITWSAEEDRSVVNPCEGFLSGGEPIINRTFNSDNIFCRNTTDNWSLNVSTFVGRGRPVPRTVVVPFSATEAQGFGIACSRGPLVCGYRRSFTEGITIERDLRKCDENCDALRATNIIYSCTCNRMSGEWFLLSGASQTVRTRPLCRPSHSALYPAEAVRAIGAAQEPRIDGNSLRTDPPRSQILLNQLVNLAWNVNIPDSDASATIRCTPSIAEGGDGEGWTTGAGIPSILLDSLPPSGRINNLSPNVTTTYQLLCRDTATDDPNCLPFMASREVRVFVPDIREIPSFYDGFIRIVGIITNNLR